MKRFSMVVMVVVGLLFFATVTVAQAIDAQRTIARTVATVFYEGIVPSDIIDADLVVDGENWKEYYFRVAIPELNEMNATSLSILIPSYMDVPGLLRSDTIDGIDVQHKSIYVLFAYMDMYYDPPVVFYADLVGKKITISMDVYKPVR